MTIKSYVLTFSVPASTSWARYATLTTPAGITRTVREIRLHFSATSGVQLRFYWETEYLSGIVAEVWNKYPIPYSADWAIPAGTSLHVEAANSTASAATVIIEIIVEEARA